MMSSINEERLMGTSRMVRVNELLKREIAEDLHRNFSGTDFDAAAITVTRVECAPDLRDANVYISIFGHQYDKHDMIRTLNRRRQEIVRLMIKRVKLKYTPRLHFHLDESLAEGDNILTILHELEQEQEQNNPES
ncbi:MAG: ribosome-binding factor A [Kiritimatiellaceae bacterium TMED266]|nr:MAG: ribosome-binding factor A [Kiritimatiellaceae bacterium TMED266]